jgi:hypothetical protein
MTCQLFAPKAAKLNQKIIYAERKVVFLPGTR